jgi:hypothetical protein
MFKLIYFISDSYADVLYFDKEEDANNWKNENPHIKCVIKNISEDKHELDIYIIKQRRQHYPSLEECVHALLDGDLREIQKKRMEVKKKFPKNLNKIKNMDDLRHYRDIALAESDKTQLADYPIDTTYRSHYREYRKFLRQLPTYYNSNSVDEAKVMSFQEWLLWFKK